MMIDTYGNSFDSAFSLNRAHMLARQQLAAFFEQRFGGSRFIARALFERARFVQQREHVLTVSRE